MAPDFELDYFDPIQQEMKSVVRLSDSAGHVRILNVINSLDTLVCARSKRTAWRIHARSCPQRFGSTRSA